MTDPDRRAAAHPELNPEDAKLIVLARAARSRTGASEGAAVRDADGRTYAAVTVALPSLRLSALQVAVASAVASGVTTLAAAAIVTAAESSDSAGVSAVRDVSAAAMVYLAGPDGAVLSSDPGERG